MDNTGTSVTSLLVTEFGWREENIGLPGQRLNLDLIGSQTNPTAIIQPHFTARSRTAPNIEISHILKPGKAVMFSSDGLAPQNDPLRQQDQDGWKNFLNEGASRAGVTVDAVTDVWFAIISSSFPDLDVVDEKGTRYTFPLLVLSDPDSVFVKDSGLDLSEFQKSAKTEDQSLYSAFTGRNIFDDFKQAGYQGSLHAGRYVSTFKDEWAENCPKMYCWSPWIYIVLIMIYRGLGGS